MHLRTTIAVLVCLGVLIFANLARLRIPFKGEQEDDGYMIKTGWPCAFREETRHKFIWEWKDFSIDAGVAASALALVAMGSELVIRSWRSGTKWTLLRMSYSTFVLLLLESTALMGVNLHERIVGPDSDYFSARGWPWIALVSGDFKYHNHVLPWGLMANFIVAIGILAGTWILAQKSWHKQVGLSGMKP